MSSYSYQLEHLIEELGGCGLTQKLLCIILYSSSTITFWSLLAMSFIGYDPGFTCHTLDVTFTALSTFNLSRLSANRLCSAGPQTTCSSYEFPKNIKTVVSEWNLVCDRRWIIAFITSVQMAGVLIGTIAGGQMSDSFGRKPTLQAGFAVMVLFNFAGYFAKAWQTYSAIRFFIGIGVGLSITVQITLMIEFVPLLWRPLVVCFSLEPLISMFYGVVSWHLHDWKRLHLLKTAIGFMFFMILSLVPESFRWLVSKRKFEHADGSISFVANVNNVPKPNLKKIFETAATEIDRTANNVYTIATLWKRKELRHVTLSLILMWFATSTTWISMSLGMESISVDIYLSIILINLVDLPASVTGLLLNRFGRKKVCYVVYFLASILCCSSGILQHFENLARPSVTLRVASLAISLLARLTVSMAYLALAVYTTELYPTVVRSLGYGLLATIGRLGAVAAPLLIHLDGLFPGFLYFICGVLIFLSAGGIARLPETKDTILPDSIPDS